MYSRYRENKINYIEILNTHNGGGNESNTTMDLKKFYAAFDYPFSFLKGGKNYLEGDYELETIACTMFDDDMMSETIDLNKLNFPQGIVEVYDYQEGIHDEKDWYFIGKVKYDDGYKYISYVAFADYTGFDCQGSMKLYISKSFDRIKHYAVVDRNYSFSESNHDSDNSDNSSTNESMSE